MKTAKHVFLCKQALETASTTAVIQAILLYLNMYMHDMHQNWCPTHYWSESEKSASGRRQIFCTASNREVAEVNQQYRATPSHTQHTIVDSQPHVQVVIGNSHRLSGLSAEYIKSVGHIERCHTHGNWWDWTVVDAYHWETVASKDY